ncbi:hypothetical protein ACWGMW_07975 [Streptomyces albidoflavus]
MSRTTRAHTVRHHLVQGDLLDLRLSEEDQTTARPSAFTTDGFSLRQVTGPDGTLVVVAGAFGPDWFATMRAIRYRLERPYVRYTVSDAPGLRENELLVRWATSAELQARRAALAQQQEPVRRLLRQQQAAEQAEKQRQDLERAGQTGLF